MKKCFCAFVLLIAGIVAGCDLQPKIASIPDSVGDFISERYPTLLAEPDSEIYKTAVADYGVYASTTVYGNGDVTGEDYVLYSPADDYMMPAQDTDVPSHDVGMPDDVEEEDDTEEAEEEEVSEYTPDTEVDDLIIPDYVNEKPVEKVPEKVEPKQEVKSEPQPEVELVRAPIREITVEKGDTLYSMSRKYSIPVNDLAVMNKMSAPFTLSVGQKLKVPDVLSVPKYEAKVDKPVVADKPKAEPKSVDAPKKVEKEEPKQAEKLPEKKAEPVKETQKTKTEVKTEQKAKPEVKTPDTKKTVPNARQASTAKKATETKKAETKKTDTKTVNTAKKTETKTAKPKTDTKKTETKKTETKKVEKTATKKTETKNAKKTQSSKPRTAQKMVARSSSKFSWPVRGKILSGYGSKSNGLFNDGINIKANRGTAVLAAENGFVAYAGNEVKGMGNLVIIQHADGWMTVYAHMDSMSVRRGHSVTVGQKIGTVGVSGKVDQPQLHFEIRKGTKAYNPISYLKK